MKIDWSPEGWRVWNDDADYKAESPLRVIPHSIVIPPIELRLGEGEQANKGWVIVPDEIEIEVLA